MGTEQVPRTVQYTDYETRSKQVPYTVNRSEQRTRMETQKYTVPITTTKTRMVPVTKKVPKTIYVDVTTQVPQNYTTTTMQTRERQVPVPYFVNIPETKMVSKQIPVYNVVAKPAPPCPPGADCGGDILSDFNRIDKDGDGMLNYNEVAFDAADANKDSQLSLGEYMDARASGNLSNTAGFGYQLPLSNQAELPLASDRGLGSCN